MGECCRGLTSKLKRSGGCIVATLTIAQLLTFIVYSILYTLTFHANEDSDVKAHLRPYEICQWISMAILTVGMVYFLVSALVRKNKSPNELYSFTALVFLNNTIFLVKLVIYAIHIK